MSHTAQEEVAGLERKMKVSDILYDKSQWLKGMSWADTEGNGCSFQTATQFCLGAAIETCYIREVANVNRRVVVALEEMYGFKPRPKVNDLGNIVYWNDSLATWEQVRDLIQELDI